MKELFELIAQYGFPMVMCLLMYHSNNTTVEKLTEAINELKMALIGGGSLE